MNAVDPNSDPRPPARPIPGPGLPAASLPTSRTYGTGSLGKGCLGLVVLVLGAFGFWWILGSPGSPNSECVAAITSSYSGVFEDPKETERIENEIAIDIRGEFNGGSYSCGFSKNPVTLEQVVVFTRNGDPVYVGP